MSLSWDMVKIKMGLTKVSVFQEIMLEILLRQPLNRNQMDTLFSHSLNLHKISVDTQLVELLMVMNGQLEALS